MQAITNGKGPAAAINAQPQTAIQQIAAGNRNAAIGPLKAFINTISALAGKSIIISFDTGQQLISAANAIIATLSGPAARNPAYLAPITALNQLINQVAGFPGLDTNLRLAVTALNTVPANTTTAIADINQFIKAVNNALNRAPRGFPE